MAPTRKSTSLKTGLSGLVELPNDKEVGFSNIVRQLKRKSCDILGSPWSDEEFQRICDVYTKHGTDWKKDGRSSDHEGIVTSTLSLKPKKCGQEKVVVRASKEMSRNLYAQSNEGCLGFLPKKTCCDESVTHDDFLDLHRTMPAAIVESVFQIFVKTLGGSSKVVFVKKSTSIRALKYHLMVKGFIPTTDVVLVHGLHVLEDGYKISDYPNVMDSSTVTVCGRLRGSMEFWGKLMDSLSAIASSSTDVRESKYNMLLEVDYNRRITQWDSWSDENQFPQLIHSRDAEFTHHVRHGIPINLRSVVWNFMLNTGGLREENDHFEYEGVWDRAGEVSIECLQTINKDYKRCGFFFEAATKEENPLWRVLIAYMLFNANFKYTQGLGFLAGMLLTVMKNQERAFWAFASIMDGHGCGRLKMVTVYEDVGQNGLTEALAHFLDKLLKTLVPKIWYKFDTKGFHAPDFSRKWFLTIMMSFSDKFVPAIWDVVGYDILVYVIAAIFLYHKKRYEDLTDDMVEEYISKLEKVSSPDALEIIPVAFQLMAKYPLPEHIKARLYPP